MTLCMQRPPSFTLRFVERFDCQPFPQFHHDPQLAPHSCLWPELLLLCRCLNHAEGMVRRVLPHQKNPQRIGKLQRTGAACVTPQRSWMTSFSCWMTSSPSGARTSSWWNLGTRWPPVRLNLGLLGFSVQALGFRGLTRACCSILCQATWQLMPGTSHTSNMIIPMCAESMGCFGWGTRVWGF